MPTDTLDYGPVATSNKGSIDYGPISKSIDYGPISATPPSSPSFAPPTQPAAAPPPGAAGVAKPPQIDFSQPGAQNYKQAATGVGVPVGRVPEPAVPPPGVLDIARHLPGVMAELGKNSAEAIGSGMAKTVSRAQELHADIPRMQFAPTPLGFAPTGVMTTDPTKAAHYRTVADAAEQQEQEALEKLPPAIGLPTGIATKVGPAIVGSVVGGVPGAVIGAGGTAAESIIDRYDMTERRERELGNPASHRTAAKVAALAAPVDIALSALPGAKAGNIVRKVATDAAMGAGGQLAGEFADKIVTGDDISLGNVAAAGAGAAGVSGLVRGSAAGTRAVRNSLAKDAPAPAPATTAMPGKVDFGSERRLDAIRRKAQDEFLPVKRMQEQVEQAGGRIDDVSDPYMGIELYKSRATERIRGVEDQFIRPIIDRAAKAGIKLDDAAEYAYALHAPERNARIASINDKMPDGGSGMTNQEAADVIAKVKASGKQADFDFIADQVRDMNAFTRKNLLDEGLIDQETFDDWNSYQRYVPLRTDMESDGFQLRPGRGLSVGGKESKAALGRQSRADNPIVFSAMQASEKIVRSEKNRVGQAMLKLVQDNPNPDLWTVNDMPMTQVKGADGKVKLAPDPRFQTSPNVLSVKAGGKTHLIEFKGEAQRIAHAMNRMGSQEAGVILRALGKVTRTFAALQTRWNPEFILPNPIRDVQTAAVNTGSDVGAKGALNVVRKVLPSIRAMWQVSGNRGKGNSEYHTFAREFLASGGKVDPYALRDFSATQKRLERMLSQAGGGPVQRTLAIARGAGELIGRANDALESGARLSAYIDARKRGLSAARAASVAQNVTTAFGRKGEAGEALSALYMFANAGIQGNAKMIRSLKSPRGRKIAAGIFTSGFGYPFLARSIAGEDAEGRNHYDNVPEFEKERNIIIPTTDGKYLKVPLPYGFNVVFNAGRLLGETIQGSKTPGEAGTAMVSSAINAFSPLGGEATLLQMLSPTLLDPVAQQAENKSWTGNRIVPDQPPYQPPIPQSQLANRNTTEYAKAMADWLNNISGGDEIKPGKIDVSPALIDHWVSWAGGGAGKFVKKAVDVPAKIAAGELPFGSMPIVSRFAGDKPANINSREFYDRAKEVETAERDFKHYINTGQAQKAKAIADTGVLGEAKMIKGIADQAAKLRDAIKHAKTTGDTSRQKELETLLERTFSQFNQGRRAAR